MKALHFAAMLFASTVCLFAEASEADKPDEPSKDIYLRFSVVGEWQVTHPLWTDTLIFRPDGTVLARQQGSTGHWILTGDGGTPLLVIRWDAYGTESVAMVTANHFRGQIEPGRFMDMRRDEEGAKKAPADLATSPR